MLDDSVRTVGFSSRERKRAFWRRISVPRPGLDVVTGVCLLLLAIQVVIELSGGVMAHEALYTRWLGLSVEGIREGRYWQFLTHALLHGGWFHLVPNVLMIWLIGGRVQSIVGQWKTAGTMVLGVIFGGMFHLLTDSLMADGGGGMFLVGASGAVMSLLLLMTTLSPDSRMFPFPMSGRSMGWGMMIASAVFVLMDPWLKVPYFESVGVWMWERGWGEIFRVSHACHLGGGFAGLGMAARVFGRKVTAESLRRERLRREGV